MQQNRSQSDNDPHHAAVQTAKTDNGLKGRLFILSGPAGVGKNTIMQNVMTHFATMGLRQMPTATTRAPRATEQEGREHFFISVEAFQKMLADNALIEYQEVYPGRFYGTPRHNLEQAFRDARYLIADIDVIGSNKLKAAYPHNVTLIFIQPPDLASLELRLRTRGQMPESEIQERLERASFELQYAEQADYRVINDNLDQTVQEVIDLITKILNLK